MRDDDLAITGVLAAAIGGPAAVLTLVDGSTVTGFVERVCVGGVMLTREGRRWIVSLHSIAFVRLPVPTHPSASRREDFELTTLLEANLEFGAEVHVRSGACTITGSVCSIGSDVLVIRATDGSVVHVAIDRIAAVGFAASDGPAMRHEARNDSTSDRIKRITRPNR